MRATISTPVQLHRECARHWPPVDRIRAGSVASAYYAARREAIMAREMAAAQRYLFWNAAKERECRWVGAFIIPEGHCHSMVPGSKAGLLRGKAYSELNLFTMGCAVLMVDIAKWPCSHMRLH